MVVLVNGKILRNSGRRTVRLKSKGDDGMNPWIQPRPSNGASFASRNTSLAGVGVFFLTHDAILVGTVAFDVEPRLSKTKGKHYDMCVRRSDTYSEEMGQSDLSRRIAHGDSGYPVLTILNPFCRLAGRLNEGRYRSASRDLQCGVTRAGQDVDVPGRYHGEATEHRINHSPVKGPRVVAGSMSRARLSVPSAVQPSNPSAADY